MVWGRLNPWLTYGELCSELRRKDSLWRLHTRITLFRQPRCAYVQSAVLSFVGATGGSGGHERSAFGPLDRFDARRAGRFRATTLTAGHYYNHQQLHYAAGNSEDRRAASRFSAWSINCNSPTPRPPEANRRF